MTETEEGAELVRKLCQVLSDGRRLAAGATLTPSDLAGHLMSEASVEQANSIAREVARSNSYGVVERQGAASLAGRRLTVRVLEDLGIAGALSAGAIIDDERVAEQIAGYMAGPNLPHVQLVGLNVEAVLNSPVRIEEWEIFVASRETLRNLLPVPDLIEYQPSRAWDPGTWADTTFLRRSFHRKAVTGLQFMLTRAYPEWDVWRPLTVIALAQPDVVTMWTEHEVEPGRHIFTKLDELWYDTLAYGPNDEVERPAVSAIGLTPLNESVFRDRVARIAALLPGEPRAGVGKKKCAPYERVKLAAHRLLAAGKHSYGSATPWDPVRAAESLLHYVVALEALLGSDSEQGEISRKIAQRAAVVSGRDDDERVAVEAEVRHAYGLRSRLMHGAEMPEYSQDLETLRTVVRKTLLARLVHDDRRKGERTLEAFCDEALLSSRALLSLREPLIEFEDLTLLSGWE